MRIFVAGPIGDTNPQDVIDRNVAIADEVGRDLLHMGHQVFIPHTMTYNWQKDMRLTRDQILELDKSFIVHWAEALYRIPGHSIGAEGEVALARALGLPIFYNWQEILDL
ncbi:hypothetical protein LCGC14_2255480 [marine sediment metagenome]|uniref:Nucleoside 2-deoxyribosyltransferase n=1 Tax=marine sediment metagenome TaxID=412755 RepID=A0A0F9D142_9ZZZZ